MNYIFIIFNLLILLTFVGGVWVLLSYKKRISPEVLQNAIRTIQATTNLNPAHAIIESHKIFVITLNSLLSNKQRTAAETIKIFVQRFPNEEKIWRYHRLRNRIAHETEVRVSPTQADDARMTFIRALQSIT